MFASNYSYILKFGFLHYITYFLKAYFYISYYITCVSEYADSLNTLQMD